MKSARTYYVEWGRGGDLGEGRSGKGKERREKKEKDDPIAWKERTRKRLAVC